MEMCTQGFPQFHERSQLYGIEYLFTLVRKQDSESEITEYASADEYLSGGMEHK